MSDNHTLIKTNSPGLLKDPKSGAILVSDDSPYKLIVARRKERAALERNIDENKRLRNDIDNLKIRMARLEEKLGL